MNLLIKEGFYSGAEDITDEVIISKNKITLSGALIDRIGLTVREVQTELPGLVLQII